MQVKDFSVSGETFTLVKNETYGYLETQPQPKETDLPKYYASEDYISHTDAKRNVVEWLYQSVKRIALKQKLHLIESFKTEDKTLLDIGCGVGDFLKTAQQKHWKVVGIEPNEKARAIANQKTNNVVLNSNKLQNLTSQRFDVITLWHVLEHLPNLQRQIQNLKSLLKPNGVIVIAVPNHKSYDAAYYKNYWAAFDVPRHLWHFSETAISKLFQAHNLKLYKTLPMYFDAYYVSLLSEKYKTGRANYIKAFYRGWRSNIKAKRTKQYSSLIYCIKHN